MIDDQAMAMPSTWAIWEFDMAPGYPHTIGWIGAGRMGSALIKRLLANGCDVSVYNRTKAKAEALVEFGAKVVDRIAQRGRRVEGLPDLVIVGGGVAGMSAALRARALGLEAVAGHLVHGQRMQRYVGTRPGVGCLGDVIRICLGGDLEYRHLD